MPRDGATTRSDLTAPTLRVVCPACDRAGAYGVARLMQRRGDLRLTDLLDELTATCPRRRSVSVYDRCGARFDFGPSP